MHAWVADAALYQSFSAKRNLSVAKHTQLNHLRRCENMYSYSMTRDQEKAVLDLITNPPPGSELAKAKEFGVDLTLLISTLRRSPSERARSLSDGARIFEIAKQAQIVPK